MNYYRIDTIHSKDFKQCSANGPGIRLIVWCQGCSIKCEGCHNFEIWPFDGGKTFTQKEIDFILGELGDPVYTGITFLGGEPMDERNYPGFMDLAKQIRSKFGDTKTIWSYTGYTFENIIKDPLRKEFLELLDILVDGPFIMKERDLTLRFRGSRNQRLIKIQETLETGKIVLYD